jgi:hypothetical protein
VVSKEKFFFNRDPKGGCLDGVDLGEKNGFLSFDGDQKMNKKVATLDLKCDRFLSTISIGSGKSRLDEKNGSRLVTDESLKLLQTHRDGTPCGSRSGRGSDSGAGIGDAGGKVKG